MEIHSHPTEAKSNYRKYSASQELSYSSQTQPVVVLFSFSESIYAIYRMSTCNCLPAVAYFFFTIWLMQVQYWPSFGFVFGLHHLLRDVSGSSAAKCCTVFTSYSLTVSAVWFWAGGARCSLLELFLRKTAACWRQKWYNESSESEPERLGSGLQSNKELKHAIKVHKAKGSCRFSAGSALQWLKTA